jgi:disulfide oxidoreductase YuzD
MNDILNRESRVTEKSIRLKKRKNRKKYLERAIKAKYPEIMEYLNILHDEKEDW